MNKRALFLFSSVFIAFTVYTMSTASASTNIAGCTNMTSAGETYLLTADIVGDSNLTCMNISASGVTLDCQGHYINYTGDPLTGYGIYIKRPANTFTNITINNCSLLNYGEGIYLYYASNNTITYVDINKSLYGIDVLTGDTNKYSHITINNPSSYINNAYGISIDIGENSTLSDIKTVNTFNAIYIQNSSGTNVTDSKVYNTKFDGVKFSGCDNAMVKNLYAENATFYNNAALLDFSNCDYGGVAKNIIINGSYYGTIIQDCPTTYNNVTIFGATYSGFEVHSDGVFINNSHVYSSDIGVKSANSLNINNTIVENNTGTGIYIGMENIFVANSTIRNNLGYGIDVEYGNFTLINSIVKNNTDGFYFYMYNDVNTKAIVYNNFINDTITFEDYVEFGDFNRTKALGTHIYGNGIYLGGNFWSNSTGGYSETCGDANKDGLCDSPLNLTTMTTCIIGVDCGDNVDYLPLSDEYTSQITININNPLNATINSDAFNFTFSKYVDTVKYSVDDAANVTNSSLNDEWVGVFAGLSDGTHNVTVWVNDSSGNINQTVRYWTRDAIPTTIVIQAPSNISYNNGSRWFNATASSDTDTCIVNWTKGNHTLTNSTGNWNYFNGTIADGAYLATFYCNNTAGVWNSTSIVFTIDTTPPPITINAPLNVTTSSDLLNMSFSEEIDYARYSLDGADNVTNTTLNTSWYVTLTLSQGTHNITVWANDTVGNANITQRWFTYDTVSPSVTDSGVYDCYSVNQDVIIRFTQSDAIGIANSTCNITNTTGHATLFNSSSTGNGVITCTYPASYTATAGSYSFVSKVCDNAGNCANQSNTFDVVASCGGTTPPSGGGGGTYTPPPNVTIPPVVSPPIIIPNATVPLNITNITTIDQALDAAGDIVADASESKPALAFMPIIVAIFGSLAWLAKVSRKRKLAPLHFIVAIIVIGISILFTFQFVLNEPITVAGFWQHIQEMKQAVV